MARRLVLIGVAVALHGCAGDAVRDGPDATMARDGRVTDAQPRSDGSGTDAAPPEDGAGAPDSPIARCGDGVCAAEEDATTCCADCGVCSEGAVVRMETGVSGGAPGSGLTPGGMADMHAYFAAGGLRELVFPFTVTDEPVAGSSWFWAAQFFFDGTTQGGYTGVQANGIMRGMTVGKMMIFSIWDAVGAEPGPGADCEPFGGEGIGYSCRLAFAWRENVTYRMVLREAATDRWSLHMHDPSLPGEVHIGTIQVLDGWGLLRGSTAGFAEYYGQVASCDTLPHAVALLHQPIADGSTAPTSVDAGVYGTCAARASSTCSGALCM